MHSLIARFADTLPFFRHYAAIVAPLQRVASIGRIVSVPLLFGLLLLIYTYVPGGRRTPRSQLPGTIFATAGWLSSPVCSRFTSCISGVCRISTAR